MINKESRPCLYNPETMETIYLPQDNVNNPKHYNAGTIECIQAIEAALTPEEFRGYCKGNAIKYVWRELHKGGNESLEKATWYLNRVVSATNGERLQGEKLD